MIYSKEQRAFLFEYIPGHHRKEIMIAFNERYPETPITINQVTAFIKNNYVYTGFTGRFEKGHISHNKGVKVSPDQYEALRPTMFKKGQRPHNFKPVGSTRVNIDGYVEVKVADPNTWRARSRLVYEQANGKIPRNHCVLHKNGIKTDDRLENLIVISHAELATINHSGLFTENGLDMNEVVINLARLKILINKRRKHK